MPNPISRLAGLVRRPSQLPPPALLIAFYLTVILIGTALLSLPASQVEPVAPLDAFFTATSAVTVTGLVVVDTGAAYTKIGHAVIMVLMQVGGLGLMTFAVLVLSALGASIGMPQRIVLREDLGQTSMSDLRSLALLILKVAVVCEILCAVLLAIVFVRDFGWVEGVWSAVFHAISAFNNAGFSLYADSLSAWVGHPVVNLVVPAMFILSGLGFVVIGDLIRNRRWHRLSLHSKIMLIGTLWLIAVPLVVIGALEWTNSATIGDLPIAAKLQAIWFQTVTPRTAGFNTVDIAGLRDSTSIVIVALMAIGGGSTSTAGGIKVTTFIVLILATIAFFRKHDHLHVFGRSLGTDEVMKVLALAMCAGLLVFGALFLASITYSGDTFDLAFEAVSAFGTVGLSRGATGELDTPGKLIICFVMFAGRVGPLTLGFFLARSAAPRVRYPSGKVFIG